MLSRTIALLCSTHQWLPFIERKSQNLYNDFNTLQDLGSPSHCSDCISSSPLSSSALVTLTFLFVIPCEVCSSCKIFTILPTQKVFPWGSHRACFLAALWGLNEMSPSLWGFPWPCCSKLQPVSQPVPGHFLSHYTCVFSMAFVTIWHTYFLTCCIYPQPLNTRRKPPWGQSLVYICSPLYLQHPKQINFLYEYINDCSCWKLFLKNI